MDPKILGVIIGATIAGVFAGLVKLVPVIAKAVKPNSNSIRNSTVRSLDCKPGRAQICIDRGETIKEHDVTIKHLADECIEAKSDRKDIKRLVEAKHGETHKKMDEGFKRIYDKLDEK
jgi:hypothetical protein